MFKTKLGFLFGAALAIASAQIAGDTPGVTVDVGGAALLHRSPVRYPVSASTNGVKGTVAIEVSLDAAGNVSDAHVLSGPEELRKASLESVLQWHFAHETAGARKQVSITFSPQAGGATRAEFQGRPYTVATVQPPDEMANRRALEARLRALEEMSKSQPSAATESQAKIEELRRQMNAPRNIQNIQVLGLSDSLRGELLSKLPVHAGDTLSAELMERATRTVREFDEHMTVFTVRQPDGTVTLQIGTSESRLTPRLDAAASTPDRIRVGGNVQQNKLVKQPRPMYPAEAKQARIQGTVKLTAIIAKDGTVSQLDVISGHPLLVAAALESVRQWVYEPTLLNGSPVEVVTQIDVNFTLSQ